MSPLPSKSLIKSHEPITSPSEIAANGNFHHPSDATSEIEIFELQSEEENVVVCARAASDRMHQQGGEQPAHHGPGVTPASIPAALIIAVAPEGGIPKLYAVLPLIMSFVPLSR